MGAAERVGAARQPAPGRAAAGEGRPAVLVMARVPRRGQVRRALEPVIGVEGSFALEMALLVAALRWGAAAAPGALHVAHDPADASAAIRTVAPADATVFPQNGEGIAGRLADGSMRVFGHHRGPLLIVWPDILLRRDHAEAALSDLAAGCEFVLGPTVDGSLYLLGLSRPQARLFELSEQAWRSRDVLSIALAAADEAGLEVGLLRVERAFHRPADVRAAVADPTLPAEVARILRRGGPPAADPVP